MTNEKPCAAVIGGGTMGGDIAVIFAAGGWETHVVEPDESVRKSLPLRLRDGLYKLDAENRKELPAIHPEMTAVPWPAVTFVVECVPEDLAVKRAVFRELESLAPPLIPITSNSSSFPISHIAQGLSTPSRMAGLHFFMPAHLVPLVEVVCSAATDPVLADSISDTMWRLGKRPVTIRKDIPGFLANRLQHALMREAMYLVDSGIAAPEDVDAAVRYGFGFRFLAAGPLLQKDLSGLDIHCKAAAKIYPDLCNGTEPGAFIRNLAAEGHTGIKSKKGFYDWTEEKIQQVKTRYAEVLMAALTVFKEEGIKKVK